MTLVYLSNTLMASNRPDAIRCGADNSCCDGAIYIAHSVHNSRAVAYWQIYNGDNRYVVFNQDGSYHSSSGHYDSRKGC